LGFSPGDFTIPDSIERSEVKIWLGFFRFAERVFQVGRIANMHSVCGFQIGFVTRRGYSPKAACTY
jgi:hypothetical protein